MNSQAEQIREQQKQNWNRFSPGWKKWDLLNMMTALAKADDKTKAKIEAEVFELINDKFPQGRPIAMNSSALLISGTK